MLQLVSDAPFAPFAHPGTCARRAGGERFCRAASPARARAPDADGGMVAGALQRRARLWERVEQTAYATLPPLHAPMATAPGALAAIGRMLVDPLFRKNTVFAPYDDLGDVRPPRQKLFHTFGSVAKATFEADAGHRFSGLFRSGAPCLLRLSLAGDEHSYVPGVAIKFFVENSASLNLVAVPSLDGQSTTDAAGGQISDRDFFAHEPTTSFAPARGPARLLEGVLGLLSRRRGVDPRRVSLQALAAIDRDGETVSQAAAPEHLRLRSPAYHLASTTGSDFRVELEATCRAGEAIYEVWAESVRLGVLRLESPLVASAFGDTELAFRHHA